MFPWLWFWSPHLQYPFGGNVEQDYKPFTNWGFFRSIRPDAGDGQIEQKIFDVASYGRQLGLITEVILNLVEKAAPEPWKKELKDLKELEPLKRLERVKKLKIPDPNDPLASLARLKIIQMDIEEIKKQDIKDKIDQIKTMVKKLRSDGDKEYIDILNKLNEILDENKILDKNSD